jgi:hypothetical protein
MVSLSTIGRMEEVESTPAGLCSNRRLHALVISTKGDYNEDAVNTPSSQIYLNDPTRMIMCTSPGRVELFDAMSGPVRQMKAMVQQVKS